MADTMINAGGGLSKSKLALADATTADVLVGKKFYSGDKTLKTGELKGYVTSPTLSKNAPQGTITTWNAHKNTEFPYNHENGADTQYFVRCTGAAVSKLASNKIRVTVYARGGWKLWDNVVLGASSTWTFDVTLD